MYRIARCPRCSKFHEIQSFEARRQPCPACRKAQRKQAKFTRHKASLTNLRSMVEYVRRSGEWTQAIH